MSEWQKTQIKSLFASSLPGEWGKEGSPENGTPVLRSTNFRNDGSIDFSDIAYRTIEPARLTKRRVVNGTILIEKSGGSPTQAAGRIVFCDCDFNGTASNFIEVVNVRNGFQPKYIAYLLFHLYQSGLVLKYQQQTTGIINFKLNQYVEEPVSLPSDELEQAKIAQILSVMDRAIEQTEALIAKQVRIKTGLMQDLFTYGIDKHGNLRSKSTHKFRDSDLGRIPAEWDVRKCISICKQVVVGIVIRPVQYYKPDGVPVFRSANVKENKIDPSNLVFMSKKDNEMLSKSQVASGDLVTVRTGYPGTTAVVPPEFNGSNCVDVVISRPNHERVRSEFLSIWVNSDGGKRQVLEGQGGLAQQHFNVGAMKSLLVKVPGLKEQESIETLLIEQRSIQLALEANLAKLKLLKCGLMQDLLSGTNRVTSLLD